MKKIIFKRIVAFVIDWIITFVIGGLFFLMGPRFSVEYLLYPSVQMFSAYGVFLGVSWFLLWPVFKDCLFNCAGLGKVIMRLKIVDRNTFGKPSASKLILRNVTFYFFIVEFVALLVNKGSTIGDLISNTTVQER